MQDEDTGWSIRLICYPADRKDDLQTYLQTFVRMTHDELQGFIAGDQRPLRRCTASQREVIVKHFRLITGGVIVVEPTRYARR